MARPCGCGNICNCLLEDGYGTIANGAGTPANPHSVDFNGAEVIDQGLQWNPTTRKLSTKIVFGGGLAYDPTGALYVEGGGGNNPGPLDLMTPLEGRETGSVIGGMLGAGYLISPEHFVRSYELGLGLGLDIMHVGVRYLRDGTPVAMWDQQFGRTVNHPYNVTVDHWADRRVEDQQLSFWNTLPHPAGMQDGMVSWQPHKDQNPMSRSAWEPARLNARAPEFGWFGYLEPPQFGGTRLEQLLDLCQNRIPLALHLLFPSTIQEPNVSSPYRSEAFLTKVRRLIQAYRMQYQVLVCTNYNTLTIPAAADNQQIDVLGFFSESARLGPVLENTEQMAVLPPESFADRGWTWALLGLAADDPTLSAYPAAGIHSLTSPVNRHSSYHRSVELGMRGILSGDPIYIGATMTRGAHPIASHSYRYAQAPFDDHTVPSGLLNPHDTNPAAQSPPQRGVMRIQPNDDIQSQLLFTPQMTDLPNDSRSYWVLQGWCAPWDNLTNWSINFHLQMDGSDWSNSSSDWMGFAFCLPTDKPFHDSGSAEPVRPGETGYVFYMAQDNRCYITRYVDGGRVEAVSFSPLTPIRPGRDGRKQFRVCVSDDRGGIRVCAVTSDGLVSLADFVGEEYMNRGGYIYFGRRSADNRQWTGRVIDPTIRWGLGTADWDAAAPPSEENLIERQLFTVPSSPLTQG